MQVWDALLGNVKHAFLEVTSSDISAMCLDHRKRKIIVGDVQGAVQVDRPTDRQTTLPPSLPLVAAAHRDDDDHSPGHDHWLTRQVLPDPCG